jgi:uncharacterized protein YkwD
MKKPVAIFAFIAVFALLGVGLWWFTSGPPVAAPEPGQVQPVAAPNLGQIQQAATSAAETVVKTVTDAVAASATETVAAVIKDVSAPPPLRAQEAAPISNLTQEGVLAWTNAARRNNGGLAALALNAQLNVAAEAKLQDMFAKQYFAHISPSNVGPGDLATRAGYDFLSEGENLALGNFTDDQALVQAWMNSPGHRANILGKYNEIGIAVGQGTYEGNSTWLAVQEFGRPLSACAQADPALKAKINADKASLDQLKAQADAARAAFEALPKPQNNEQVDAYNAKIGAYNAVVEQIRTLGQQVNGEVTVYNGQVQAANACAGE